MEMSKRIAALMLSVGMTLNTGVCAFASEADSVIGFNALSDAAVTVVNATMANAVTDTAAGRLVIRPNFEKNAAVELSDFAKVSAGRKFVKIRYAFREAFNTEASIAVKVGGTVYALDTLADKQTNTWYEAVCEADFAADSDRITIIPVYTENGGWTTGGDVLIDYVGIFASRADAVNYAEKDQTSGMEAQTEKTAVDLVDADRKFMDGYKEVKHIFKPDNSISRAETISVLSRIITGVEETEEELPFTDIDAEAWYYSDVKKLYSAEAISGTEFRPNDAITRGELAEILYNLGLLNGEQNTRFADISVTDALYPILIGSGSIFSGYTDNTFRPDGGLTRAEAVATVNRLLGVEKGSVSDYSQGYEDVPPTHWAYCDIMAVSDIKVGADDDDEDSGEVDGIFDVYNKKGSEWIQIPIRSQEYKDKGISGGEGGQYLTCLAIDSTGQYIAQLADIKTVALSKDGGKTYTPVGKGISGQGLSWGCFDPNNSARFIGAPMRTQNSERSIIERGNTDSGLYISEDYMDTFTHTMTYTNFKEFRAHDSICFDPTSYSDKINGSAVVYFSTADYELTDETQIKINEHEKSLGYHEGPGLYRSDDGGYTWKFLNDYICGADIAVSYDGGVVYATTSGKLYRSTDKGETFEELSDDVFDIDAIKTRGDGVYVLKSGGVYFAKDGGNLSQVGSASIDASKVGCFRVSPVNQSNMAYSDVSGVATEWEISYTTDGGTTWGRSITDNSTSMYTVQPRNSMIVYSPVDGNKLWRTADLVLESNDAGATFVWANDGASQTYINNWFTPNIRNRNLWFVPIQDFRGAITTDGGDTFKDVESIIQASHTYGGYMVDENTFYWIESSNWEPGSSVECPLYITFDGGKTAEKKGIVKASFLEQKCFEAPGDHNVLFAGNLRSADGGKTWREMDGIRCVSAFDPTLKDTRLFALGSNATVQVSKDNGETWKELFKVDTTKPEGWEWNGLANVLKYDYTNDICYYMKNGKIHSWKDGVDTSFWEALDEASLSSWFYTFEIDPIHPEVLYAAGCGSQASYFPTTNNYNDVVRSCDGGKTWQVISPARMETSVVTTGPVFHVNSRNIWVDPNDGWVYMTTNGEGIFKFPPPYELD